MSEILFVRSLTTALRPGVAIVDGISFGIKAGETFALLGESGCGKSMTALSLMRLLPDGIHIESGEVLLDGSDILALPERAMREVRGGRMAMIFQEPGLSLNPVMTVGEQIAEALELHWVNKNAVRVEFVEAHSDPGKIDRSPFDNTCKEYAGGCPAALRRPFRRLRANGKHEIEQRCIELLEQVGIPDAPRRLHEYPFQLSGGMKQRVMIAMALAGQPELLVADEPTTALDVTIQAQVLQLLRDTQERNGMALLLITHDLGVVAQMAHQVAVMYAGHIVEQASRAQLFARPAHPYTQKLFAALPAAARGGGPLAAIPGNVPLLGDIPNGCRFAPRCDRAWALCHERAPEWAAVGSGGVRCHLYGEGRREKGEGENLGAASTLPPSLFPLPCASPSLFPPHPSLLEVAGLKVHFPIRKGILQRTAGYVKAVDGVSLSVAAGRTLALVGESGCGKTTAGKALLQLVHPTAGSVCFAGSELVGLDAGDLRKKRAGMQMVFQDPYASLNPKMRVAEILQEGMDALLKPRMKISTPFGLNLSKPAAGNTELPVHPSTERTDVFIDALLEQVGLSPSAKWRYPHEFSGGQRQRIAIARALAVSPRLLICDEPTSALDVSVQAQILNLLKALQRELELSYLFITHNLAVVEYLAHEVCVMYLGRIVERGLAQEVLGNAQHPYTRALLAAVPRMDGQGAETVRLPGDMPSPANPPQGCHFHPRCAHAMPQCRSAYPGAAGISATHDVHCHLYGK
ncbi:MAG: peptide ABC transporter ATPase [Gallionellaceae bacterium]|nr:MAG: peptide ABC transporter ATPase [Gallionellaceae bacterium]